jgi:hypothetical protein
MVAVMTPVIVAVMTPVIVTAMPRTAAGNRRWRRRRGVTPVAAVRAATAGEHRGRGRADVLAATAIISPIDEPWRLGRRRNVRRPRAALAVPAAGRGNRGLHRPGRERCARLRGLLAAVGLLPEPLLLAVQDGSTALLYPGFSLGIGAGRVGRQAGRHRHRGGANEESESCRRGPEQHGFLHQM